VGRVAGGGGAAAEGVRGVSVPRTTAGAAAEAADDALVEAIREELLGEGRPLSDWQPLPSAGHSPTALSQVRAPPVGRHGPPPP